MLRRVGERFALLIPSRKVLGLVLAAVAILTSPANATTINILPISSDAGHIGDGAPANNQALAAIQRAADLWESILLDPIILNFRVDFTALGPNVLADATPNIVGTSYTNFLAQVDTHLATNYDTLLDNLPAGTVPLSLPSGFTWTNNILMTTADAKVLGFSGSPLSNTCDPTIEVGSTCDGMMRFATGYGWDLDSSDGVNGYDMESVAVHEIGHALGFFSEVDTIDFLIGTGQAPGPVDISVLDLYRFADCQVGPTCAPTSVGQFSTQTRSMNPAVNAVTGVVDNNYAMSRGFYASGYQASHWANLSTPIGIMNPTAPINQAFSITDADKRAMRALGYDVNMVPEPSSFVLISAGCAALAALRRRRAQRPA